MDSTPSAVSSWYLCCSVPLPPERAPPLCRSPLMLLASHPFCSPWCKFPQTSSCQSQQQKTPLLWEVRCRDVFVDCIGFVRSERWASCMQTHQTAQKQVHISRKKDRSPGTSRPTCFLLLLTSLSLYLSYPLQSSYGERSGTFQVAFVQKSKCRFW